MGHIPYGYRIENGIAVIDEVAANKLCKLYENYLAGMSLKKAAEQAGIDICHSSAKRMMMNTHYIGDSFYPAIIDKTVFNRVQAELIKRSAELGRLNRALPENALTVPTVFTVRDIKKHYDNPLAEAEYIYSLIESEVS